MDWPSSNPGCCCHTWPPEPQHNIEGCLPSKLNLQHSSYLTDGTVIVHYKSKMVSAVHKKKPHNWGNRCSYCENDMRHKYTIWENNSVSYVLQQIVCVDIRQFWKVKFTVFSNIVSMPSKFPPLQWGSKEINQWNLVIVVIIIIIIITTTTTTTTIKIKINYRVT